MMYLCESIRFFEGRSGRKTIINYELEKHLLRID